MSAKKLPRDPQGNFGHRVLCSRGLRSAADPTAAFQNRHPLKWPSNRIENITHILQRYETSLKRRFHGRFWCDFCGDSIATSQSARGTGRAPVRSVLIWGTGGGVLNKCPGWEVRVGHSLVFPPCLGQASVLNSTEVRLRQSLRIQLPLRAPAACRVRGGGGGERLCSPDSLLPVGGKWPRNALKRLYSQASSANNNSNNNNNTNNNNITNNNNNKTVTTTTTKKGKNSLFETFSEIDKCTRFLFTCKDTLFKTAVVTDWCPVRVKKRWKPYAIWTHVNLRCDRAKSGGRKRAVIFLFPAPRSRQIALEKQRLIAG